MYAQYFGLNEKPFSIAPDPRYLYQSERHAEALAHLLYGVEEAGGFIQLTGEVGTGKTTLTRVLLNRLPVNVEVAMILNPRLSVKEFLQNISEELQLDWAASAGSVKEMIDGLNAHLLSAHAAGHRVVLIIDEAQNLDADLLEQIRLLTNLETTERKLLQIILIGQPELRQTLARADLRQLAQRITGRYHLDPLTREETSAYIHHRLQVAGASREIFSPSAVREVHRLSGGVPRLINVICDRALLGAYGKEKAVVDARLAREAAGEVMGHRIRPAASRWLKVAAVLAGLALGTVLAYQAWQQRTLAAHSARGTSSPSLTTAPPPSMNTDATVTPPPEVESVAATPVTNAVEGTAVAIAGAGTTLSELQALLTSTRSLTDNKTAFTEMFRLWDKAYVHGGTRACDQAAAQGLKCLFQRGSWNHLVTLNVPAILSLTDANGEDHQVLLAGIESPDVAVLRIGEANYRVSLQDILGAWFGDSLLLWRPHPEADQLLGPGTRNAGVQWLREGLARLDNTPLNGDDPMLYDEALAEQVRAFQRHYGLRADGIAGERTLVKLQALLLEPGIPLLRKDG